MSEQNKRRVLSGMRPTGRLHLGNYMGALYNWVRLQDEYECYFFIADYHALTTDYADPSRVKQNTLDVALDWLGAGLDPEKCVIFVQSHVPQHAELHLLFSMFTPLGWLERVPTYKDQQEQLKAKDLNTYGFLGYPLLQAADILLYQANYVPVGEDQVAHVELTREVARKFNSTYGAESLSRFSGTASSVTGQILPEPDVLLTPSPKLPGLDGRKMSKSYNNTIMLTDLPGDVELKIHGMTNGGQRSFQTDPGDPDKCPVGDLHKVFSSEQIKNMTRGGCREATIPCITCKQSAAMSINQVLMPLQERRQKYADAPLQTWDLLESMAEKARASANETMKLVKSAMGIPQGHAGLRDNSMTEELQRAGLKVTHRLVEEKEWWDIESPLLRGRLLRDYWLEKMIPSDIVLQETEPRVSITPKKKRVYITSSRQNAPRFWRFSAKPKSYEVIVLLCWEKDEFVLHDFVIPQKVYVEAWTKAKKAAGKNALEFSVTFMDGKFQLELPGSAPISISEFESQYDSLR